MIGKRGVKAVIIYIAILMMFVGLKVFQGRIIYVTEYVTAPVRPKFSSLEKAESGYQSVMCQKDPQASYPFCNGNLDFVTRTNDLVGV